MKLKRILAASAACAVAAAGLSVQALAAGGFQLLTEPLSSVDGALGAVTNYANGERAAVPIFYWNDEEDGFDGVFDITSADLSKWRSTGEFTYTPVDCDFMKFDDLQVGRYSDCPQLYYLNDGGLFAYKYDGNGSMENYKTSMDWFYPTYDGWTIALGQGAKEVYSDLAENDVCFTATYYGDDSGVQITKKFTHDGTDGYLYGTQDENYLGYVYYPVRNSVAENGLTEYDIIVQGLTREGELVEIYTGTHNYFWIEDTGENFLHFCAANAPYPTKDYVYLSDTGETLMINWGDARPYTVNVYSVNDYKAVVEAKDYEGNSLGYMLLPLEGETYVENYTTQMNYKYIGYDYGGIYLVQTDDDKWGYINAEGELLATYDNAGDFMGNYAPVVKDGKAFLINKSFKRVSEEIDAESVFTMDKELYIVTINGENYLMTYAAAPEESDETVDKPEQPEQPADPAEPDEPVTPAETTEPTDTESAAEAPTQDVPSSDDGDKANPDTGVGSAGVVLAIAAVGAGLIVLSKKRS